MKKVSKTTENVEKEEGKVYEIGYLLLPTLAEEQLAGEVSNIISMIEKRGGVFLSSDGPALRDLVYTMVKVSSDKKHRFNEAYFGWIKFEMQPDEIKELKNDFDLYQNFLRYLLINSVKESVAVSKKFSFTQKEEDKEEKKEEEAGEEKVVVKEVKKKKKEELGEEIDKTIDDLVV